MLDDRWGTNRRLRSAERSKLNSEFLPWMSDRPTDFWRRPDRQGLLIAGRPSPTVEQLADYEDIGRPRNRPIWSGQASDLGHTSIDSQFRSGHDTALLAGKEEHCCRNLNSSTGASKRDHAGQSTS